MTQLSRRANRAGRSVRRRVLGRRQDTLDYVFIVTYGRSGSTLLAGILNSIPGYLIRGENRDSLHRLFLFHRTLRTSGPRGSARENGSGCPAPIPFFGIGDFPARQVAGTALRRTRHRHSPSGPGAHPRHRLQGDPLVPADLPEYVDCLTRGLPRRKFIVNTRNHDDVLASKFWRSKPRDGRLERNEDSILEVAAGLGEAAYHVHFDDYVRDPSSLTGLFDWLGESFDEARVRSVMGVKHSY